MRKIRHRRMRQLYVRQGAGMAGVPIEPLHEAAQLDPEAPWPAVGLAELADPLEAMDLAVRAIAEPANEAGNDNSPAPAPSEAPPAPAPIADEDEPPFDPPAEGDDVFEPAASPERRDSAPRPAHSTHPRAVDLHALARAAAQTFAQPLREEPPPPGPVLMPAPAISIYASWDRAPIGEVFGALRTDRRLSRATVTIERGGLDGAAARLKGGRAPDLVIIDTTLKRAAMLDGVERLTAAAPGAKIIVIGAVNDVSLFRELAARGVSEYVVGPLRREDLIGAVCRLYAATDSSRVVAVIGARGGAGASTIAHNIAWSIAERQGIGATLVDLDVAFGVGGLALDGGPAERRAGGLEFLEAPSPSPRMVTLAAPAALESARDIDPGVMQGAVERARRTNPFVVLDVPHAWNSWVKQTLVAADDVVIVAAPDLASLRNAKNIVDMLVAARGPDGAMPIIVLSMVGVPKRPEITQKDFSETLLIKPAFSFAFEPTLFGVCEFSRRPIGEAAPQSKAAQAIDALATALTGKEPLRRNAPAVGGDAALLLTADANTAYLELARRAAHVEADPPKHGIGLLRRIARVAAAAAALLIASLGWHIQNRDPSAHAAEAPAAAQSADALYAQAVETINSGRTGDGVALLRRAAEAGFAPAQHRLAKHYERGEGVPADLALARAWTERAAGAGLHGAMHDAGVYAARGEGGSADAASALRWFHRAATAGVVDSQYNLGLIYAEGSGAAANAGEALFWFLAAAAQGDEEAAAAARALEPGLTPDQITRARARAGALRAPAHNTGLASSGAEGGAP